MSRYLKDLRGRPVKAPQYRPSGDQNPEGRAAKRRRKQLARQGLPVEAQHTADSCEAPRADRQEIAWVNTAPRPAAIKPRLGLGLTRGIIAAALLATLGTDKPKE